MGAVLTLIDGAINRLIVKVGNMPTLVVNEASIFFYEVPEEDKEYWCQLPRRMDKKYGGVYDARNPRRPTRLHWVGAAAPPRAGGVAARTAIALRASWRASLQHEANGQRAGEHCHRVVA